ncbi:uncharacterized protein BYT42DRAFT_646631 [Radiomyces spectabilis]|uniref:uncharacterized protein n=1 Tax=Radiomyces spectabilis TaxID=64574 RepID=UPI00221E4BC3|nr:uncharacterized protein BYT42DRAFT_646631 [Radiomyces spectabilis]KAI8374701.1 hypothetical protein BYT42DRAFT_646631 [Radiomyces spectabilis]
MFKKKQVAHDAAALTIELLPEFGWTHKNEPVYGPGSIFKGVVRVVLLPGMHPKQLRIVFHASESVPLHCVHHKHIVNARHQQFFGTQRILWDSNNSSSSSHSNSQGLRDSYPFILQMPMVQFPPSMDCCRYKCSFRLTATLDMMNAGQKSLVTHKPVHYMPFVETCLLKTPLIKDLGDAQDDHIKVKMNSLDYLPGDTIQVTALSLSGARRGDTLTLTLYRVTTFMNQEDAIPNQIHQICSKKTALNGNTSVDCGLELPNDLIPSFSYGRVIAISYKLHLALGRAKSGLSKLLVSVPSLELPVTIGTLGYGVRAAQDLQVYTMFQSVFDDPAQPSSSPSPVLPVPKFIRVVEYEDALPQYEATRLPSYYSDSMSHHDDHASAPLA